MSKIITGCFICVLLSVGIKDAKGATVTAPNALATTEGNSDNLFPFGNGNQRYQQIYGTSEFASFGSPQQITAIAFRPDGINGSAFSGSSSSVQIRLSTTSQSVDGLDSTFANNVGGDVIEVFNGPLTLSSSFTGPAGGPKAFDIQIPFSTPFIYDPNAGNLLLDISVLEDVGNISFDIHNASDSISRAVGNLASSTANIALDSRGLVTQFTFEPVSSSLAVIPEPSSLLLLSLGLLGMVFRRRATTLKPANVS